MIVNMEMSGTLRYIGRGQALLFMTWLPMKAAALLISSRSLSVAGVYSSQGLSDGR